MRATATLSGKLERNLLAYATVAAAAGVGMASTAQPAEGRVVYTPIRHILTLGETYYLDLNHDGIGDFGLTYYHSMTSLGQILALKVKPASQNEVLGSQPFPGFFLASALPKGVTIGTDGNFYDNHYRCWMVLIHHGHSSTFAEGNWVNVKNRYLGFRFKIEGVTHYGWSRLSVHSAVSPQSIKAVLTGFAFETIPDKPIIAGNRGSTTGQGPEAQPVGLGRLALGAAGKKEQHQNVETSH